MRRFVAAVLTVLCCAGLAAAQSETLNLNRSDAYTVHAFAPGKDAVRLFATVNGGTVAVPATPIDLNAPPTPPAPAPTPPFGHYEGYRFQLSVGYSYFRFRSTPFNANLSGLQTSLSYFLNDWFAVEGNAVAATEAQREPRLMLVVYARSQTCQAEKKQRNSGHLRSLPRRETLNSTTPSLGTSFTNRPSLQCGKKR